MNEIAEYGIAAHALYKDTGGKANGAGHAISKETNAYAWLRRTIEQLAEGDNPEEFLENTKLELFQDQVFCFTPKGMLIALPRGATPIDFAYAVHTDVGDTCVGAKINGRIMPLMTELKNGDEVEIIRSKAQVPPAAWESIVVTGKARAAIRRATKNAIRKQYSGLGARILERAFERAGKTFHRGKPEAGAAPAGAQGHRGRAGRGRARRAAVDRRAEGGLSRLSRTSASRRQRRKPREEGWSKIRNAAGMLFQMPGRAARARTRASRRDGAVPIRGVRGDLPVRFAPEGAVPGDRIVGIVQPGAGITIYPIQSPALQAFDDQPERWIDVRWDIDEAHQGALSGAHLGHRDQRAGIACRDRPGRCRQRRQHPYAVDGAHRARFHRNADRPRSLGPEASEPAAVAAQGQFERQRCAARQRLTI